MTVANPLQAEAQAILDQMQDAYACRMPRNFQTIAINAIVYALGSTRPDNRAPHGNQRPITLPNGRPIPDAARDACLSVLQRRLFKFADVVQALVDNGVAADNRAAQTVAEKMLLKVRRSGAVIAAGRRGYWQCVNVVADQPSVLAAVANDNAVLETLRNGLIQALGDFQLIAQQTSVAIMADIAKQSRERVLLSLVEAA